MAGLMDCRNLGTEGSPLCWRTTRAGETRCWMPNNRYAQAYIKFQQGLGLDAIANAPAGWVFTNWRCCLMCGIGGTNMVGIDLLPTDATEAIFNSLDDRSKPQLGRCLAVAGMLMNSK